MKLLFLILAHDRPEDVVELARYLTAAATDATALIHYDARSPERDFAVLERAAAEDPRLRLVQKRAKGAWGSFGLVEAPLGALAQAEAEGLDPDYVVLLSGSCLPSRPVAQLERYLAENAGREFIEVEDENWIGDGWRSERWRYRFWFDHKTQRPAEWAFFHVQRLLGLTRRFPDGLTPRFGSQWWALTWTTCRAILAETRAHPERLNFFRTVWIPDEIVFQTYVHALVPPERIAGFGLTHFQFSNRGKPVVFHNDHIDYVGTLPRFFFRKTDPEATALRRRFLERASHADDGASLERIGSPRDDYQLKITAQTHYPRPGHVFYRNQYMDMVEPVLATSELPYIVLVGPSRLTRLIGNALNEQQAANFTVLGEIFSENDVGLGEERKSLKGLHREDTALRDAHPALFLMRARERAEGVPVLRWSPFDHPRLLDAVLHDGNALVVTCLPHTGFEDHDRTLLMLAQYGEQSDLFELPAALPGTDSEKLKRARIETVLHKVKEVAEARHGWLFWLGWELFHRPSEESMASSERVLIFPWTPDSHNGFALRQKMVLANSLNICRFSDYAWFADLRNTLQRLIPQRLQEEVTDLFEPIQDFVPRKEIPPSLATGEETDPTFPDGGADNTFRKFPEETTP